MSLPISRFNTSAPSGPSGTRAPQSTPNRGNSPNTTVDEWWAYGYVIKGWQDYGEEHVAFRFGKGPVVPLGHSEAKEAREGMPNKCWKNDLGVKVTFHPGGAKVKKVGPWDGETPEGEVLGEIPEPPK